MNLNMNSIRGVTITYPNGRVVLNVGQEDEVTIETQESMKEIEEVEIVSRVNDFYKRRFGL